MRALHYLLFTCYSYRITLGHGFVELSRNVQLLFLLCELPDRFSRMCVEELWKLGVPECIDQSRVSVVSSLAAGFGLWWADVGVHLVSLPCRASASRPHSATVQIRASSSRGGRAILTSAPSPSHGGTLSFPPVLRRVIYIDPLTSSNCSYHYLLLTFTVL